MLSTYRRKLRALIAGFVAALLSACATNPQVISESDIAQRVQDDWSMMFADVPESGQLITLSEAIARSIKYNLDNRLKLMEAVVANRRLDLSDYEKLPRLAAAAGYTVRNKQHIANSINVDLGGLETDDSTSQDKKIGTADLQASWNTLDFGIAYLSSQQTADQMLISVERQRKIVHNIIKDVRYAYWRMISAQGLQDRLQPLMTDIRGALNDAAAVSAAKLAPGKDSLEYQRALLDIQRQMTSLRRDLQEARVELTALIGLPPGTTFKVQSPTNFGVPYRLDETLDLEKLEQLALHNRPELLEEDYRTRIAITEIKKARLKMFPGAELFTGYNYNDNSFLRHQDWASAGVRLTWNLLNVISGPAAIRYAKSEKELADIRRMALSMAVLTQVDVALFRSRQAQEDYGIAREMLRVDSELHDRYNSELSADAGNRLTVIRSEARKMLSELRYALSYAEWHNSVGQLYNSVGYQPAAILDYTEDLPELTSQVQAFLDAPAFSVDQGFYKMQEANRDAEKADDYRNDELRNHEMSTVQN